MRISDCSSDVCSSDLIWPVGVEEEIVEPVRQIVMMGNVLLRAPLPVEPIEPRDHPAAALLHAAVAASPAPGGVGAEQDDEVENLALDHHQPPVHIGLAAAEARIPGDVEGGAPVGQPDDDTGAFGIGAAKAIFATVMFNHHKLTALHHAGEQLSQQRSEEHTSELQSLMRTSYA